MGRIKGEDIYNIIIDEIYDEFKLLDRCDPESDGTLWESSEYAIKEKTKVNDTQFTGIPKSCLEP